MGEAAKALSADFKAARPGVPWRAIAGIRDRIVHEYFRTNTRASGTSSRPTWTIWKPPSISPNSYPHSPTAATITRFKAPRSIG